jgi:hypothetical protein
MTVTLFKNFWSKKPTYTNVDYVLDKIRDGAIKDKITEIRETTDLNEIKRLKELLPCVLFSGKFSERLDSALTEHSGLICLDFDKFKSDYETQQFKEELKADPYTYAIFESPSGKGLKVLVKITNRVENHRKHFRALNKHYNHPNFDNSCINESRICFMSYDKDIHINKDSEVFTELQEIEIKIHESSPTIQHTDNNSRVIEGLYKWWDERHGFVEGQRNRNVYILAAAFNDFGVPEIDAINFLSQFEREDFSGREIKNCVESAYKKSHLFGTKAFSAESMVDYDSPVDQKAESKVNISDIFLKSYVDVKKPLVREPVAISMGSYMYKGNEYPKAFGSYGNFSCLVGASKAKKSFAKSMILAPYLGGTSHIHCGHIKGHRDREMFVLDIDTEQGSFHAQRAFKRVMEMCGIEDNEFYKPFALRPYSPTERVEFIEWLIYESDFRDNIGLLAIDGLVDLCYDFNDIKESNAIIQKIMKWTDDKQFHLNTVIHTNPNTTKPSGHIGTSVLKKAETICLVTKETEEVSLLQFPFTRGVAVQDFRFSVKEDWLPYVMTDLDVKKQAILTKQESVAEDDDEPF